MPPKRKRAAKQKPWATIAAEAQAYRDSSLLPIKETIDYTYLNTLLSLDLPPIKLLPHLSISRLTSLPPSALLTALTTTTLTSTDILSGFVQTACLAHHYTNCLTSLLLPRAKVQAQALDTHLQTTGTPIGALHGIPISIKSHLSISSEPNPAGYTAWYPKIAPHDCLVVQILTRAGAVIHARTTEPQGMMQLECASNLYGVTINPFNTALSPGGSSGGEGALLAMQGSCIGVGSDVGGSIRVPAAACGLFGLKPTGFRVPTTGWSSTPPGADPVPTVIGPMCRWLEGVEMFMNTVVGAEAWGVEPALVPMPWRTIDVTPLEGRRLRIGVAVDDGVVFPHPPVTRVLKELMGKLEGVDGVDVVPFGLYKHDEGWAIASSLYFTDGGEADKKAMEESGEPMLELTRWIMENDGVKNLTREELEYWLEEREEYRLEYTKHWNETGRWDEEQGKWVDAVDVIICPVAPGVATQHGTAKYWSYSAIWNLVDYPALTFPAGKCDKDRDAKVGRTEFMSDLDVKNWSLCEYEDR
ncbi:hypothetical protein OQA88_9932 [Cercophora sp. LCS_1]